MASKYCMRDGKYSYEQSNKQILTLLETYILLGRLLNNHVFSILHFQLCCSSVILTHALNFHIPNLFPQMSFFLVVSYHQIEIVVLFCIFIPPNRDNNQPPFKQDKDKDQIKILLLNREINQLASMDSRLKIWSNPPC